MDNQILSSFRKGKPSIGTLTHLKSMVAVENLGAAKLDYVLIDLEHCPVSMDEAAAYLTAAKAAEITPVIRVNERSRSAVLRALDAGAMGVIVPCIETVEQVRELVNYAKFQPTGDRGYCMTRDGKWGFADCYRGGLDGYMAYSNENTMLIPQCETMGCLEHIEEITAMDGVDGILIGPYDLSIAMGIPGQFQEKRFRKAVRRILKACKDSGKLAMFFSGNTEDAKKAMADGFDSILLGLDVLVLINGYRAMVEELR